MNKNPKKNLNKIDPVKLTADLINCPSVTPNEGGALTLVEKILSSEGFRCNKIVRNGITNLFARWGKADDGLTICFNGHTDVVPPGDINSWSSDPFSARIRDGYIYGRGATDMKSALAAFISATSSYLEKNKPSGSIVFAITGDEEGQAKDGTLAIIDWMKSNGEHIDHCLVGEPTSDLVLGDTIKIGRRGSVTVKFTAMGLQGHTAYPEKAKNPLSALINLLSNISRLPLDDGSIQFEPSSLVITTIDTGNMASNVIPETSSASINIRFNNLHSPRSILSWLEKETLKIERDSEISFHIKSNVSAIPFLSDPGEFSDIITKSIKDELNIKPVLSTSGGTSDARFLQELCPVVEFGLVGETMHKTDEHVEIDQINKLTRVYNKIIENYFQRLLA